MTNQKKPGLQYNRRLLLLGLVAAPIGLAIIPGLSGAAQSNGGKIVKLEKTREQWQTLLDPEAFRVLFKEATERPFTSALNDEHREGVYVCAACYLPLFESTAKFDSGTGWPSFFQPIEGAIGTKRDFKILIPRTEYHCIRCTGHQGHLFNDGPRPTGQRWCNNGVALQFVATQQPLPELRS
jgi:peptide-methionine (R)-S-oxide reductase